MIKLILTLLAVSTATAQQSNCKKVTFTLNGVAANKDLLNISLNGTLDSILNFYNNARLIAAEGTQIIKSTFCSPTTRDDKNNARLQVLFHSITADRTAWSALGGVGSNYEPYKPEVYSWVRYANGQGYPTLAIDRLGNGKSDHPDPILTVQASYEISLYHDLAMQIREGHPQLPSLYMHLVFVGNSYGSQLGIGMAGTYPKAYDEYILTGVTSTPLKGFAGVGLVQAMPAQIVDPFRFATLPVGYLTTASEEGRTNAFFGSKAQVDYEDTVADLFFDRKDVVSIGQFVSIYAYPFNGTGFKGRVLLLDGEQDQPYCGPGSPVIGPAECGRQPRDTGVLFPDADYNYQTVDRVGHAVQEHVRSPVLFDIAHRFLAGENFGGGPPV
ncbi:hypothetical protein PRZ48_012008 [Zasmidium cellare]|uniref:AB hydrolase-1 domain-containing protein n=1 Tax=Zasmidium cellare TaxID=395010 RepID=A0ABR0E800_ZASCE|nr:hypothetical protein PRZ48_012008 [Zasmidium cellare]